MKKSLTNVLWRNSETFKKLTLFGLDRRCSYTAMLKDSIRDCIAEYLSSASPSSAKSAAASRITSLCDPDDIEMFCWTCWSTFIDAAAIVPNHVTDEEQTERIYKLVHLVAAVRDAEPLRTEKGEIVTCWGKRCWNDLPLLGPSMREAWDRGTSIRVLDLDTDKLTFHSKNATKTRQYGLGRTLSPQS